MGFGAYTMTVAKFGYDKLFVKFAGIFNADHGCPTPCQTPYTPYFVQYGGPFAFYTCPGFGGVFCPVAAVDENGSGVGLTSCHSNQEILNFYCLGSKADPSSGGVIISSRYNHALCSTSVQCGATQACGADGYCYAVASQDQLIGHC